MTNRTTKLKVLILCTGNSCRSQMAEGLLRHISGGKVNVFSAGVIKSYVHPLAITVMQEIGIDISGHTSKSLDVFAQNEFDLVITVCDHAKDVCPVFPGAKRTLHIPFEDPVEFEGELEERLEKFRATRDAIKKAMELLFKTELQQAPTE